MTQEYIRYWASLVNESEEMSESYNGGSLTKDEKDIKDDIDKKAFVFIRDIMKNEDFGGVYYDKDTKCMRIYLTQDYDLSIKDAVQDIIYEVNKKFNSDYGITISDEDAYKEKYVEFSQGYGS